MAQCLFEYTPSGQKWIFYCVLEAGHVGSHVDGNGRQFF